MKWVLLPTVFISCTFIMTHLRVTTGLGQPMQYDKFISNLSLPSNASIKQIPNLKIGVLKENCALSCHQIPDCLAFCYNGESCAVVKEIGMHGIQEIPTELNFEVQDCFYNTKVSLSASDAILQAIGASNVALYKPVRESSLYRLNGQKYPGSLVVDGNFDRRYNGLDVYCVITNMEETPWLLIDLQATFLVMFVNITNNANPVQKMRFHDVEVRVGMDNATPKASKTFTSNYICFQYERVGDDYWFSQCMPKPILGQYVSLQIIRPCLDKEKCPDEIKNGINLSEVQIYAFIP